VSCSPDDRFGWNPMDRKWYTLRTTSFGWKIGVGHYVVGLRPHQPLFFLFSRSAAGLVSQVIGYMALRSNRKAIPGELPWWKWYTLRASPFGWKTWIGHFVVGLRPYQSMFLLVFETPDTKLDKDIGAKASTSKPDGTRRTLILLGRDQ